MKVLLLGGTGTLSTDIMLLSVQRGYDVFIMNRGRNLSKVPSNVKVIKADFFSKESVLSTLGNRHFDVVVDFLSRCAADIERIYTVLKSRCKQYIFISTACVYCRADGDLITEKSAKPNKDWTYNTEKYAAEQKLVEMARRGDFVYTIIRPYITYNNARIPFGLMPEYGTHWTLIGRLLCGKPFFVWNAGENFCTLTHTKDFAIGMVGLFGNKKAYNEDFHITTAEYHTWKEMLQTLLKILNSSSKLIELSATAILDDFPEYKGMLLGDRMLDARFDISKIKSAVPDYNPCVSLEEGLTMVIDNYKAQHYLKGIDYIWDAKVDRMLAKQQKEKIAYCDYLQEHKKSNRYTYMLYRYFHYDKLKRIIRKLLSVLK